jgi:predicted Zn-dependent peptidase
LGNGLQVFRIGIEGARVVTAVVGFNAGSRSERVEENGVAHFLEHLVFKGGQDHPTYREVNTAAEVLGARMNAFTASDVVAFYITVRSNRVAEAADLLTDFTARPRIDPEELEKERQVVIQEIARSHDQPSSYADELIDRATFGEHPLGRPTLGTEECLRSLGREEVLGFRARCWAGKLGGAILVGDPDVLSVDSPLDEFFERFPAVEPGQRPEPAPPPTPQVIVERRDSRQSHLRLGYRPAVDSMVPQRRAALIVYATLLGGTAGSRLFDEIREQRGLAYSVSAASYPLGDTVMLQLSAGLRSSRCVEAFRRMREIVAELAADGPTEEEVHRARSVASGRRAISFESTTAVAREAIQERVAFGETVGPDEIIARLDAVELNDVLEVAQAVGEDPAVACVGPHAPEDFA